MIGWVGDAKVLRALNGWFTLVWIVMVPISYFAGWLDSVTYVSALSLWALVSGHWAAWQAARVEVNQEREAVERDERQQRLDEQQRTQLVELEELLRRVTNERNPHGTTTDQDAPGPRPG